MFTATGEEGRAAGVGRLVRGLGSTPVGRENNRNLNGQKEREKGSDAYLSQPPSQPSDLDLPGQQIPAETDQGSKQTEIREFGVLFSGIGSSGFHLSFTYNFRVCFGLFPNSKHKCWSLGGSTVVSCSAETVIRRRKNRCEVEHWSSC